MPVRENFVCVRVESNSSTYECSNCECLIFLHALKVQLLSFILRWERRGVLVIEGVTEKGHHYLSLFSVLMLKEMHG
jgi:hypothetical protein